MSTLAHRLTGLAKIWTLKQSPRIQPNGWMLPCTTARCGSRLSTWTTPATILMISQTREGCGKLQDHQALDREV